MARIADREDEIVCITARLLEAEGDEAVTVRRIASEASISLTTLYKLYGSRDELVLRALELWMAENVYADVGAADDLAATPGEGAADVLIRLVRRVYARWERQPHMLVAFVRARMRPGGRRLDAQGFGAVMPTADDVLAGLDLDPDLAADVVLVLQHVNLGTLERFANGEIGVAEIVEVFERTLRRLLADPRPPEPPFFRQPYPPCEVD